MAMTGFVLPELNKPQTMTAQQYAYARLRHGLMVGAIAPGVPVTIRGLAEVMNISPTPVREALRRLSSQNALSVLENRRIVVPEMTPQRFNELVSLRASLEKFAAERALPFVSDRLIDEMEEIDHVMDRAVVRQDRVQLIILNQKFHSWLFCANPDQASLPMIESVWLQLGPFTRVALQHIGAFYAVDRHKEILTALRQRDLAGLKLAIHEDIHDAVGGLDEAAMQKILGPGA